MPFLLVIGAAYAAYAANSSDKKAKTSIDPSISVRGKSVVKLHELERQVSIMEHPIGTLSFFEGNYKAAAAHLERRCREILQANPWLAGWLVPMPDLQVLYDPKGSDRPPGIFQVFEPGAIPLKDSTAYELHSEMLRSAVVPGNAELVGQNLPLWRVSVIPDAGEWDSKFAVAVTMSHAIGDAHTYYKFYNMLHCEARVEALNPVRKANLTEAINEDLGKADTAFMDSLISASKDPKKEAVSESIEPKEVVERLSFEPSVEVVERRSFAPSVRKEGDMPIQSLKHTELVEKLSFEPSAEKSPLLRSFKQHQAEVFSELNVVKMFYVDEEWVMRKKGRRGSVFEADSTSGASVATAAALTANSIISSWFFRINEAAMGILMVNLRRRLSHCDIQDLDAGNYVYTLVCNEDDSASPGGVQRVVQTMHSEVKEFDSSRKSAMVVNWANFYDQELKLADDCRQTVHLPIYNTTILHYLPDKVSAINIFTARCAGNGNERRAGAFVVCQESVWEKILESGIVAEMITEM